MPSQELSGSLTKPKPYQTLYCTRDNQLTAHYVVRVLAKRSTETELALCCSRCGLAITYVTDRLPDGLRIHAIHVVAEAGPDPVSGQLLPSFEEDFLTLGASRQDAYERSLLGRKIAARGQVVRTFIDGAEHLDERF